MPLAHLWGIQVEYSYLLDCAQVGQVIGIVVADTKDQADAAAALVRAPPTNTLVLLLLLTPSCLNT